MKEICVGGVVSARQSAHREQKQTLLGCFSLTVNIFCAGVKVGGKEKKSEWCTCSCCWLFSSNGICAVVALALWVCMLNIRLVAPL